MNMNEHLGLVTRDGKTVALRGVEVDARILGLVAETSLSQQYRNDTSANLEVAYTFPLPVDGVLLDFEATLGSRIYRGHVITRRDAETKYEQAIEQGDAAFRLQKLRDGLYTATLGNLKPGEEVVIRLRYGETLRWQAGRLRYRLPTVIAPRYGQPTGMQPWQKPITDLAAQYPFTLRIQVLGELARAGFECASHRIAFAAAEGSTTLTLQGAAWLDRDFVLDIQTGLLCSLGATAEALDTRVALVNLLPPAIIAEQGVGRDFVILLDCSGSMAGDSIAHAKEGVGLALNSLTSADRFAVVGFGSHTVAFDKELQPANRKNLTLAESFVEQLPGLGGTETGAALELALAYGKGSLDILLLTDGECWGLETIAAKARSRNARIFTIGIGSAVAEDTVRMLSDETGGACELLTPNEDMATRIAAHFGRMRQPRILRTEINWGQTPVWTVESRQARFAGDTCLIWAQLQKVVGEVKATLQNEQGPAIVESVALVDHPGLGDSLVRLAAAARLLALSGQEYVDWSLRYQLVTEETDYLVTVERAEEDKASEFPVLQVVPQMLAAGWGGSGTVRNREPMFSVDQAMPCMSIAMSAPAEYEEPSDLPCMLASPTPSQGIWTRFIEALEQSIGGRGSRALPSSLRQLIELGLPNELIELLRSFVKQGAQEAEVVRIALDLIPFYINKLYRPKSHVMLSKTRLTNMALQKQLENEFHALNPLIWQEVNADGVIPDSLEALSFMRQHRV